MAGGRKQLNAHINEPSADAVLVYLAKATGRLYIQRITYSPGAYVAGTVLNFIDSLTQASIGSITVQSPGVYPGAYVLDLGGPASGSAHQIPGTPLSVGANLQLSVLSGGCTGRLDIQAYQLPLY